MTATFCGDTGWSGADSLWAGSVSPEELWYGNCLQGLQQESDNDQCHSCSLSWPHQGMVEVSKSASNVAFTPWTLYKYGFLYIKMWYTKDETVIGLGYRLGLENLGSVKATDFFWIPNNNLWTLLTQGKSRSGVFWPYLTYIIYMCVCVFVCIYIYTLIHTH